MCCELLACRTALALLGVMMPVLDLRGAGESNRPPAAVWDVSTRVELGGGYRHNVLLTTVAPENSPFVTIAGDVSLIRLSETGSELTLFFMGQELAYTDAPSVDDERFASGTVQVGRPLSSRTKVSVELSSLYQNQIMDVSDTETNLSRILVEGVGMSLRPKWNYELAPGWDLRVEAYGGPQLYHGEVDSYWEAGGKVAAARTYGNKSEWSIGEQFAYWMYGDREQNDISGEAVPGTALRFWRPELFGQWRHHWDERRHWLTTTRLGWLWNIDNGSGYWNYVRLGVSQKVRWRRGRWEIGGGARFGYYHYQVQTVGEEQRERLSTTLDLRVERTLKKHWFVYAAAEGDWNWSNEPLDEYRGWSVTGGVGLQF